MAASLAVFAVVLFGAGIVSLVHPSFARDRKTGEVPSRKRLLLEMIVGPMLCLLVADALLPEKPKGEQVSSAKRSENAKGEPASVKLPRTLPVVLSPQAPSRITTISEPRLSWHTVTPPRVRQFDTSKEEA